MKKKKDRGAFLTILIIMALVGGVTTLYSDLTNMSTVLSYNFENPPLWYQYYFMTSIIITLISVYGIYRWQKWGVYLLIAHASIAFLIQFLIRNIHPWVNLFMPLVAVIMNGLWFWAIYRKRKYFA